MGGIGHNGTHTVANVTASPGHAHWETVEQILSATSPTHPTRISHTRRSAAHRRAIQTRQQHRRGPARHIGARVPHHRERPRRTNARRQGGVAASQPRLSPLLAIPPPCFFQAAKRPIATTRERVQPPSPPSSSLLRPGTPQRHSGRCARQPLLPPGSGTLPHPLDRARSEGECCESGSRPQGDFSLHRLGTIHTVVYLNTRTLRTARVALAHTVDTNQVDFCLSPPLVCV